MIKQYLNSEEFKVAGEIPLLLKLRMKQIFKKKTISGGKVLVVDTCIIGDFIATLPALRMLIQSTDKEVDLIVSPLVKPIAQSIKGVHAVYTASSIYRRSAEMESEPSMLQPEYELVLVLRISPHAFEQLKGIRYSNIITYEIILLKYFAHLIWNIAQKKPVRQWREVNFEIINKKEPDDKLEFDDIFTIRQSDYDQVRDLIPMTKGKKRIIIHTGSGWHVKLWENDKWLETILRINRLGSFDFIFVGRGELEPKTFDYIQDRVDIKLYSLVNSVDLRTTLLVMRLSDYFIGIDSGPRNIAHLADLRSITFLGPAPQNFMPVNKADIVIDKFTCRCKSLFYFHKVSAIRTLSVDEVVDNFKRLLSAPVPSKE